MDGKTFDNIQGYFKRVCPHFLEVLAELYNHRDLVILRIKNKIDEKTKFIMKLAEQDADTFKPTIYKHEISIQE